MAGRFDGASPAGIWIVGVVGNDGSCYLNFPSSGQGYRNIVFSDEDRNSDYLDYFDAHGVRVWLEVEPGDADVETLIGLMLDRYAGHPCVVGVGVDVEWYQSDHYRNGKAVTDSEALSWRALATEYSSDYSVFLKHWEQSKMPPTERAGLLFVDDSQGFASLDGMVTEFQDWANGFAPAPVAFQYGYAKDKSWWGQYDDPASAIGLPLLDFDNTAGLFWVDFTVEDVFPPCN